MRITFQKVISGIYAKKISTLLPECQDRGIFKTLIENAGSIESRTHAIKYGERAVFIKSIETTI